MTSVSIPRWERAASKLRSARSAARSAAAAICASRRYLARRSGETAALVAMRSAKRGSTSCSHAARWTASSVSSASVAGSTVPVRRTPARKWSTSIPENLLLQFRARDVDSLRHTQGAETAVPASEQSTPRARLDDASLLDDVDQVGAPDGREAV